MEGEGELIFPALVVINYASNNCLRILGILRGLIFVLKFSGFLQDPFSQLHLFSSEACDFLGCCSDSQDSWVIFEPLWRLLWCEGVHDV